LFLVPSTVLIAAAIPKLDLFISLVGALSSSCLALIFPPCIDLLVRAVDNELSAARWRFLLTKNIFIIVFGLVGFATGTYISIKRIVEELL
jgi:proton-coupled amino acid transporter